MSQYWYTINLANCVFGNSMKIVFLLFPEDEIVIKTTARNDIKLKGFALDTASVKVHSVYTCTIIKI